MALGLLLYCLLNRYITSKWTHFRSYKLVLELSQKLRRQPFYYTFPGAEFLGKALFCCYCCINYLLNRYATSKWTYIWRCTVINLFHPLPLPSTYPQRNFYMYPLFHSYHLLCIAHCLCLFLFLPLVLFIRYYCFLSKFPSTLC